MFRISLLMLVLTCSVASAQESQPPAPPKPAPAAPAQATSEGADLVVVRVAGEPITEKQVVSRMGLLARQVTLAPDQQQNRARVLFQGAVEDLVTGAVLRAQAAKQKIVPDQAIVDKEMQAIAQRYASPEEFQKALQSQGGTEAGLRKSLEENLAVQKLLEEAAKVAPAPTDAEIQKFYNDNPTKFDLPERVRAAHILLSVDPKSTAEQKAEIRKKLEGIRADIEAGKIAFADAATKFSQDKGSASTGGDLGFFTRGQMVKPFEDAAFSALPGTLTPVVETAYGFHIINVMEKKPAGKATLEDTKEKIREYLDQTAKRKVVRDFLANLKTQTTIERFMTFEEFEKRHPGM